MSELHTEALHKEYETIIANLQNERNEFQRQSEELVEKLVSQKSEFVKSQSESADLLKAKLSADTRALAAETQLKSVEQIYNKTVSELDQAVVDRDECQVELSSVISERNSLKNQYTALQNQMTREKLLCDSTSTTTMKLHHAQQENNALKSHSQFLEGEVRSLRAKLMETSKSAVAQKLLLETKANTLGLQVHTFQEEKKLVYQQFEKSQNEVQELKVKLIEENDNYRKLLLSKDQMEITQGNLVSLYKEKISMLEIDIGVKQELMKKLSDEKKALVIESEKKIANHEKELSSLQSQLDHRNRLAITDAAFESSNAAALVNTDVTSVYEKLLASQNELSLCKKERHNYKTTLDNLLSEVTLKAPLIAAQTEKLAYLKEENSKFQEMVDEKDEEIRYLKDLNDEIKDEFGSIQKRNQVLAADKKDLAEQVQNMLREQISDDESFDAANHVQNLNEKLMHDLNEAQSELSALQKDYDTAMTNATTFQGERDSFEARLIACNQQLEQAHQNHQIVEVQETTNHLIEEDREVELETFKQQVERLQLHITNLEESESAHRAKIIELSQQSAQLQGKLNYVEQEEKSSKAKLLQSEAEVERVTKSSKLWEGENLKLTASIHSLNTQYQQNLNLINQLKSSENVLQTRLDNITAEKDEFEKMYNSLVDKTSHVENLGESLARIENQLTENYQTEILNLQNHIKNMKVTSLEDKNKYECNVNELKTKLVLLEGKREKFDEQKEKFDQVVSECEILKNDKLELTESIEKLKEQVNQLSSDTDPLDKLQEKLDNAKLKNETLEQLSVAQKAKIEALESASLTQKNQLQELTVKLQQANELVNNKSTAFIELKDSFDKEKENISAQLAAVKEELSSALTSGANYESIANSLKSSEQKLREELAVMSNNAESSKESYNRELALHSAARQELSEITAKYNECLQNTNELSRAFESVKNDLASKVQNVEEKENLIQNLNEQISSFSSTETDESLLSLATSHRQEKELLTAELSSLKQQLSQARSANSVLQDSLQLARSNLEKIFNENQSRDDQQADSSLNQLLKDSNNLLRKEVNSLRSKLKIVESDLVAATSEKEIDSLKQRIKNLSAEKVAQEATISSLNDEVKSWRERINTLLSRFDQIDPEEHKQLQEALDVAKKEAQDNNTKLEDKAKEIASTKALLMKLNKDVASLKESQKTTVAKLLKVSEEKASLEKKLEGTVSAEELTSTKQKLQGTENDLKNTEGRVDKLKKMLQNNKANFLNTQKKYAESLQKVSQLEADIKQLRENQVKQSSNDTGLLDKGEAEAKEIVQDEDAKVALEEPKLEVPSGGFTFAPSPKPKSHSVAAKVLETKFVSDNKPVTQEEESSAEVPSTKTLELKTQDVAVSEGKNVPAASSDDSMENKLREKMLMKKRKKDEANSVSEKVEDKPTETNVVTAEESSLPKKSRVQETVPQSDSKMMEKDQPKKSNTFLDLKPPGAGLAFGSGTTTPFVFGSNKDIKLTVPALKTPGSSGFGALAASNSTNPFSFGSLAAKAKQEENKSVSTKDESKAEPTINEDAPTVSIAENINEGDEEGEVQE